MFISRYGIVNIRPKIPLALLTGLAAVYWFGAKQGVWCVLRLSIHARGYLSTHMYTILQTSRHFGVNPCTLKERAPLPNSGKRAALFCSATSDLTGHPFLLLPQTNVDACTPLQMPSSTSQSYIYTPLPDDNYIRLLALRPRSWATDSFTPTASLHIHPFNDKTPRYTTLSYSWGRNSDGDASLSHELVVNGKVLMITANLYDFLIQHVPQSEDELFNLWVDAVCINQSNIPERNAQVARMQGIYSKASSTIVWLGMDHSGNRDQTAMEEYSTVLDAYAADDPSILLLDQISACASRLRLSYLRSTCLKCGVALAKWHRHSYYPGPRSTDGKIADVVGRCYLRSWTFLWSSLIRLGLANVDRTSIPFRPHLLIAVCLQMESSITAGMVTAGLFKALGQRLCRNQILASLDAVKSILSLVTRRYWARRWIYLELAQSSQETTTIRWASAALSPYNFKRCYKASADFAVAFAVLTRSRECLGLCGLTETERENLRGVDQDWEHRNHYPNFSGRFKRAFERNMRKTRLAQLLDDLCALQDTECADDRDRLFALLAMSSGETFVDPDYSLSAVDVYVAFASKLVQQGYAAQVLYATARQLKFGTNPDLPSWVPDLRERLPLSWSSVLSDSVSWHDGTHPQTWAVSSHGHDITTFTQVSDAFPCRFTSENRRYKWLFDSLEKGDIICGLRRPGYEPHQNIWAFMFLGPVDTASEHYKLLFICKDSHDYFESIRVRLGKVRMATVTIV
jgi:hypothetical protein